MLILKNIYKSYKNEKNILKNINLIFKEKGLVTMLGKSGSGKTTLLNIIGLLDKPSNGLVIYKNKILNNLSKKKIDSYHYNEVGFIYQNYNLIDYMSVKDNIKIVRNNKDIEKIIRLLDIEKLINKKVKNLSGGEKQRVAIARSLINNPSIIVADEPTGALDEENSKYVMELLKELSKEKLVILVTHNNELADLYSDRIIKIQDGEIVDDTDEYLEEDEYDYKLKKYRISKIKLLKITKNNLLNKFKRNLLTIIAISIGLISLSLVIGISNGFKKSLDKEEKESLSYYPIFISKSSVDLQDEFNNIFKEKDKKVENKIYSINVEHTNKITKKYVNNLNVINNNLKYKINTYYYDSKIITTSNSRLEEIDLLKGNYPTKDNEVLLLLDSNNSINREYLKEIKKTKKEYEYDELLNYEYKIKKKKYKITCIAKIKKDSVISDISGLIYNESIVKNKIPESIYLFPKSYKDKLQIKEFLNENNKVKYTDYSTTIKSISETLINGISIVLISFTLISLIVSTIMIGILSYINIIEKTKEIGVIKSLGATNKNIKEIFYLENIILGIVSSIISIIICYSISIPINKTLYNLTGMNNILLINKEIFIYITLISILICLIGSSIPISRIRKMNLIDCLK